MACSVKPYRAESRTKQLEKYDLVRKWFSPKNSVRLNQARTKFRPSPAFPHLRWPGKETRPHRAGRKSEWRRRGGWRQRRVLLSGETSLSLLSSRHVLHSWHQILMCGLRVPICRWIRNDNRSGSSLVWDVKEQEVERSDLNREQEAGRGDLNREREARREGGTDQQKARAGGQGITTEARARATITARARAMGLLTCSTIFKLNCRWATLTPSEHFCIAKFSSPSPNQARIELLPPLIHRSVVSSLNYENLPTLSLKLVQPRPKIIFLNLLATLSSVYWLNLSSQRDCSWRAGIEHECSCFNLPIPVFCSGQGTPSRWALQTTCFPL
jgi:hypothetical protein